MNGIYYRTASGVDMIVGEGSSGCAMTASYMVALLPLCVLSGPLLLVTLSFT